MSIVLTLADGFALFAKLASLSLATNGSVLAAAPEIQRLMVEEMGLLTAEQFSAAVAMSVAAPGPNVLLLAAVGHQAAGIPGAALCLTAMLLPAVVIAYAAARWSARLGESRGIRAFRAGTAPMAIALPLATGWTLAAQTPLWTGIAVSVLTALLVWRTRLPLLLPIAAGALLGALGYA